MPASVSNAPVVSLENVHKRFGSFAALQDVSLDVRRGEFFSLLGPSGCGKTTLLRLVAGFEEPTSGRVLLDGEDTRGVPPNRRAVNTVFQHYALFPHLDVFANVAFGPRARHLGEPEVRRRVGEMLKVVRLGDLASRRPDQLSGGQRQRVALARALVNAPSALLLDEPLSALDPELRQAMQLELARIQRETGIAFVLVTHDQAEALALSDRLAILRRGRIEQVGTPQQIYRRPDSVFVAGFVGAANLLPVRVLERSGETADIELPDGRKTGVPCGPGRLVADTAAVLLVRPELVRLSASPPESGAHDIALAATLLDVAFQGPLLRCRLGLASGDDIIASIVDAGPLAGLEPGTKLWARFEPASTRLLAIEGTTT